MIIMLEFLGSILIIITVLIILTKIDVTNPSDGNYEMAKTRSSVLMLEV